MSRRNLTELLRLLRRIAARLEVAQIECFGRSMLSLLGRTEVLVLTTRGRMSGLPRSTPLACLEYGGGWLVAAGAWGQRASDWVANLRTHPHASITLRRQTFDVIAEPLVGEEYEAARTLALRRWRQLIRYEQRAGRRVPMFVLHRRILESACRAGFDPLRR